MNILPSITEKQLFDAIRAYMLTIVDVEVVRGQVDKVAMPKGDFVMLSKPIMSRALGTTVVTSQDTTQTFLRPTEFTIQVDCFGKLSGDRALVLSALFRTQYACDALAGTCVPLYTGDAKQMALINAEQNYEERWTFDTVMQYNPVITLAQQSANALKITPFNVDVNFKS